MNTQQAIDYSKGFRRKSRYRTLSMAALKIVMVGVLFVAVVPAAGAGVAFTTLLFAPLPGELPDEENEGFRETAFPSEAFDKFGNKIADYRQFDLTVETRPEDVPQVMKDALVAAEDRRFWEHNGVDIVGTVRALVVNYRAGEVRQGGSTLTQQYAKNKYLSRDQKIERKVREALYATDIEKELTKEEILFDYLQTTYFGEGAYGIGAAAETYFRKSVSDLTASEAAVIAGLIPAPGVRNPRQSIELAETHRIRVLNAMEDVGYLTPEQAERELEQKIWYAGFGPPPGPATVVFPPKLDLDRPYPYFQDWVHDYLLDTYGEDLYRGGLQVTTTLEPEIQQLGVDAIAERLGDTEAPLEMALASVHPRTGHIKALVGGRDWSQSQVNLATGGSLGMQPGSSFKTFVLANAYRNGIGPSTIYNAPGTWEIPGCGGDLCAISNYSKKGGGNMSLEAATWASTNTVYGQLILDVGVQDTAKLAKAMGVLSLDPAPSEKFGVSLSLGAYNVSPLEMASGYATIANHGVYQRATGILRVVDREGNVLEDNRLGSLGPGGERVLEAAVADTVTETLTGVIRQGTAKSAAIGRPAAGKTGTAQNYSAAWFVGYTPQLSTAVWMGYSDSNRPLRNIRGVGNVTGGSHPATAWRNFMKAAHEGLPELEFAEPGPLPRPASVNFEPGQANTPIAEIPASITVGQARTPAFTPTDCEGGCVQRVEVLSEDQERARDSNIIEVDEDVFVDGDDEEDGDAEDE